VQILGIDIGGSGIKGAPVDVATGALLTDRYRLATPETAKPKAVANVVAEIARHFDWRGPIGCTLPSVVKQGIVLTAANLHKSWIGLDGAALLREKTGCPVQLINDADAAGLAEMAFGAGQGHDGSVAMVTLGTGIGVAIFAHGVLFPNCEMGHIEMHGRDAECFATDRARREHHWSWKKWGRQVNRYLQRLEALLSLDLIIIGGGVSAKHEKFFPEINTCAEVVPARFLNQAGIIGAALAAKDLPNLTTMDSQ